MTQVAKVLDRIRSEQAQVVDFRFTDLRGRWRHTACAASRVDADLLEGGVMFDGSSISGWRDVSESDMLLRPDLETAFVDPFSAQSTLVLICDVAEPGTGLGYERDPRSVAQRAESCLASSGVADRAMMAAEVSFFVFDDVRFALSAREAFHRIDSDEGAYNSGTAYSTGNPGHRPQRGKGYLTLPPIDHAADLRAEIATVLERLGFVGVYQHHGLAPSQSELGFEHAGVTRTADRIQMLKYVVGNVAASYGKTATFMPKPIADDAGSSLYVHQSLWREDQPVFAGQGYADLSQTCLHYIGGLLLHARALNAFTNPTTNSYKRTAPGAEAPRLLAFAALNRSSAVRVPHARDRNGKRIEARFPDPSANPYLALAAMLMAGLDGIENQIDPGEAMDRNLYDLPARDIEDVATACPSLRAALEALDGDREFLTRCDVMPSDLIDAYIAVKTAEADRLDRTPHPIEFDMYYSV